MEKTNNDIKIITPYDKSVNKLNFGKVNIINCDDDFVNIIDNYNDTIIILYFFAEFCNESSSEFEKIAKLNTDCLFLKINIEECTEITKHFKINSVPTFICLKETVIYNKTENTSLKNINLWIKKLISEKKNLSTSKMNDSIKFGNINTITEKQELDSIKNKYTDNYIIVDFYAKWCAPCKRILPKLTKISSEFNDCLFIKIDIDESEELAKEYDIKVMPTFLIIHNTVIKDKIEGANIDKIMDVLKQNIKLKPEMDF